MAEVRKRQGKDAFSDAKQGDTARPTAETRPPSNGLVWTLILLVTGAIIGYCIFDTLFPCPIDAEGFDLPDMQPFTGALTPNTDLPKMEKIFQGKFRGPESMAIHNGKMYTGVADGRLVEIDLKTGATRNLVEYFGKPPCGSIKDEPNCGRPLGVRYNKGFVYVVDAYLGLFKVNATSGEVENLFKASHTFPDGKPARFLNDVEVDDEGRIYVTDSSYTWGRSHHCYVGFENKPNGRLIEYNPKTKESTILLKEMYFANGLQLTYSGDAILITEMSRNRVSKYYIKGAKKGQHVPFAQNLPGLPDNIRFSSSGGYWVAFAVVRHPDKFSPWDFYSSKPWLRNFMARILHRNTIGAMVPKYSLVIELDKEGEIVRSLHDPEGKTMPAISEVQDVDGVLYIGSYYLPFLGKLDMRKT